MKWVKRMSRKENQVFVTLDFTFVKKQRTVSTITDLTQTIRLQKLLPWVNLQKKVTNAAQINFTL